jgi:hypothetical protein
MNGLIKKFGLFQVPSLSFKENELSKLQLFQLKLFLIQVHVLLSLQIVELLKEDIELDLVVA